VKLERHVELVNCCDMKPKPLAKILTTWQPHLVQNRFEAGWIGRL